MFRQAKITKLVLVLGVAAAALPGCSARSDSPPSSSQGLCFDAYRLRVLDPSGRTGPIKGELLTARETIPFACPHSDLNVSFRCSEDGGVGLGFGPRQGHRQPPGEVRLIVWENPRPNEPLDVLWSGRDEVLWEGVLSTDFLNAPRDQRRDYGCLKSELTLHVETPFPMVPEPEREPEPEVIGPCGPDTGVHDGAPCERRGRSDEPRSWPDGGF